MESRGEKVCLLHWYAENIHLSSKSVNPAEMLSAGNRGRAGGVFPQRSNTGGMRREKYCMNNIFWKRLRLQQNRTEKSKLDTRLNIMISGKSSDEENLRSVVRQLFCFRLAMNYVILSDAKKQGGARSLLALALAVVALHPEAAEGVKTDFVALMVLWGKCDGICGTSLGKARTLMNQKNMATVIGVCIPDWFGGRRDGGMGCRGWNDLYAVFTDLAFIMEKKN